MSERKPKNEKPTRASRKAKSEAAKPGRKWSLTPQIQDIIVAALRAGNYLSTAADFAGVPVGTVYEWIARGEGRDKDRPATPETAAFAEAVKKADSFSEVSALKRIQDAARGGGRETKTRTRTIKGKNGAPDQILIETTESFFAPIWQADAWLLERRFADRWGRKDRHELSSPGSDRVEVNLDLQSLIAKIYGNQDEPEGATEE